MKNSPSSSFSSSSSNSSSSSVLSNPKVKIQRARKNAAPKTEGKCSRSSIYRGVTRHRCTGRFEAHLWDKHTWNNIQNKKGRQVYLGAYNCEDAAARTYDLAALKYWGPDTSLNFSIENYQNELVEMSKISRDEYVGSLRRQSDGFSRGVSKYRGVARHHHNGRWEARIGRVWRNKYLYLGTYSTQEEAAAAYDVAAIRYRGASAVTNFNVNNYLKEDTALLAEDQSQRQELVSEPNGQPGLHAQHKEGPEMVISQMIVPNYDSQSSPSIMSILKDPPIFNHDHVEFGNWSVSLDTGFNLHPVPHEMMKSGEILPRFFYETGFEDNIADYLFDSAIDGAEVSLP